MDTAPTSKKPRVRTGRQVNFTLTAAEEAMFRSAAVSWVEPGTVEPRTETLGRTIKRLAIQALGASPS